MHKEIQKENKVVYSPIRAQSHISPELNLSMATISLVICLFIHIYILGIPHVDIRHVLSSADIISHTDSLPIALSTFFHLGEEIFELRKTSELYF